MSHLVPADLRGVPSKEQTQPPVRRLYLLYHELRSTEARYSYVTCTKSFERHLDLYSRLRKQPSPHLWPEITFDDGHVSNLELAAPRLEAHGLTAHFFITVGWTGNKPGYMEWPQVRALHAAGHTIGAHGWNHTLLTHCNEAELQNELGHARMALEDKLGSPITSMSLPGGRFNERVLKACKQAGYSAIFTSIPQVETLPLRATIGRLNILGDMQPEWLEKLFQPDSLLLYRLGKRYRQKEAVKKLVGDKLYAKLWALVNRKEPDVDSEDVAG
jgi:peptidoglycan/xylan/chitin deacetylase (PgdA/CDA1 family)